MTDTSTTAIVAAEAAKTPKVATVLKDMDGRRLFDSTADAAAYLQKCRADFADFDSHPVAAVGLGANEAGELEFDSAIYTAEMRVAIAVLTKRGEGAGLSTVQAIVIYPSPTQEAILSSATGKAWLAGIMEKELNHVAVRNLRKAESEDDIAEALQTMPTTLENFITSGRESTGGILEAYNDLWQTIKQGIAKASKTFLQANLSKKELRKAMESASYAAAVYPVLENRKNKAGESASWFLIAAQFGQELAKQESKDPTVFDKMIATRNEKQIVAGDDNEDDDFDPTAAAVATAAAAKAATPPATDATQATQPAA